MRHLLEERNLARPLNNHYLIVNAIRRKSGSVATLQVCRDRLVPFGPQFGERRIHINSVPQNDGIDDQPERTELIFLAFAVALPA